MWERAERSPIVIYNDFLNLGQLPYQFSLPAQRAFFPPRIVCPYSGTDQYEWRMSAGLGTVHSVSHVHSKGKDSYAVVLVDFDEGFRMLSRVIDGDAEAVGIGSRVAVAIRKGETGDPVAFVTLEREHG
jgi:uncharacterized OB-fold protein